MSYIKQNALNAKYKWLLYNVIERYSRTGSYVDKYHPSMYWLNYLNLFSASFVTIHRACWVCRWNNDYFGFVFVSLLFVLSLKKEVNFITKLFHGDSTVYYTRQQYHRNIDMHNPRKNGNEFGTFPRLVTCSFCFSASNY